MKRSAGILLLLAALLLFGCSRNPQVAGGDDYPNSVNTLGKQSAQERSDTSEWNSYKDAPSSAPGLYDTTTVPDSVPQSQAATASDTFTVTVDSNTGRVVHIHVSGAFRSSDTTVYQPANLPGLAQPQLVSVSGLIHYESGVEKRYRYQDGDGDGFLSAQQASNVAAIHLVTTLTSGEVQEKNLRLEAGADLDFNAHADNRLLSMEQTDRIGSDTVSHLLLLDADGDGAIFNPAIASGNRVDVRQTNRSATTGTETTSIFRIVAFADSTKNHPVRFHQTLTNSAGVRETWALGHDSLPDFAAGDSGWVKTVFTPVASDSLSQSISTYSILISSTGQFTGDKLLSVNRTRSYRLGDVAQSRYHLQPLSPIPDGGFATIGDLTLRLDFTSGKWIELQGGATATETSGLYTDSQGRQSAVHFAIKP